MDLILWRHAQAQVGPPGWQPDAADAARMAQGERPLLTPAQDLARRLTPKGDRQAERMAAWLNQRLPASTRVLVSPAERTRRTAQALGRDTQVVDALAPDAQPDAVLQAARWPRSRDPVLIVGHQPTLGAVVAQLLLGAQPAAPAELAASWRPVHAWSIKKGAVWWLQGRQRDGVWQVTVQAVQNPDLL